MGHIERKQTKMSKSLNKPIICIGFDMYSVSADFMCVISVAAQEVFLYYVCVKHVKNVTMYFMTSPIYVIHEYFYCG